MVNLYDLSGKLVFTESIYLDHTYHLLKDSIYSTFDGNKITGAYNWKKDSLLKHDIRSESEHIISKHEDFIKAYVQSFNNRVVENKLIP